MNTRTKKAALAVVGVAIIGAALAGCGGGTSASSTAPTAGTSAAASPAATPPAASAAAGTQVLPVASNPITNTATAPGLTIAKVLVENNLVAGTKKAADDHLEIVLTNTSATPLDQVSIYYAITDPKTKASEGYFTELSGFVIDPAGSRTVHFDNTGAADHYPVNKYSLYYTSKNALVIDITASAAGVKPATFTIKKDAGGAEGGVE